LFHSGFFGSGGYCTVMHCQVSLRAQPLVRFEVVFMPVIGGVSQGKVYSKQSQPPDVRTQRGDPTSEECLAAWKAGISKRQASFANWVNQTRRSTHLHNSHQCPSSTSPLSGLMECFSQVNIVRTSAVRSSLVLSCFPGRWRMKVSKHHPTTMQKRSPFNQDHPSLWFSGRHPQHPHSHCQALSLW
jgi:hypothetical protein